MNGSSSSSSSSCTFCSMRKLCSWKRIKEGNYSDFVHSSLMNWRKWFCRQATGSHTALKCSSFSHNLGETSSAVPCTWISLDGSNFNLLYESIQSTSFCSNNRHRHGYLETRSISILFSFILFFSSQLVVDENIFFSLYFIDMKRALKLRCSALRS